MKKQFGRVSFLTLCGIFSLGISFVIAFKAFPAYLNYWFVQAAVEELQLSPPRSTDSNAVVYRKIQAHLQDNGVYDLEPKDLVTITGRGDGRQYVVDYKVNVPLFFNADLLLNFGQASSAG